MHIGISVILLAVLSAATTAQDVPPWMRPDLGPPPTSEQVGQTWVELDGQVYGAVPSDLGPIGGSEGYARIITEGDYNVSTIEGLLDVLGRAQPGEVVYLHPAGDFDFTTLTFAEEDFVLAVPEGVTLASNRGHEGSRGAVLYTSNFATRPLICPMGPNVRITGLWLLGPDPKRRLDHHRRSFSAEARERHAKTWPEARSPGHVYYYRFPTSAAIERFKDALEVDNCEISGWTRGVSTATGAGHHIHHCYIHHCQYNGLGYGVTVNTSQALIEYNLFDANRHSIAGTGRAESGYTARHNVELGISLSHCFDMHADPGGSGIAGDWMKMYNNTFRAPIRAIAIRGVPREQADVYHNWFYHAEPGADMIRPWPTGGETNVELYDNAYGLDEPTVQ